MKVSGIDEGPVIEDVAPDLAVPDKLAQSREAEKLSLPESPAAPLAPADADSGVSTLDGPTVDGVKDPLEETELFKQWNEKRPEGKKVDFKALDEKLALAINKAEELDDIDKIIQAFYRQAKDPKMQRTTVGAVLGNSIADAIVGTVGGLIQGSKMIAREFRPSGPRVSVEAAEKAVNALSDGDIASTITRGINSRNRDSLVDARIKDINNYIEHIEDRGEMLPHDFAVLQGLGANAVEEFKASADRMKSDVDSLDEYSAEELERQNKGLQMALTRAKQVENDKEELSDSKKKLDQSIDRQREEAETVLKQVMAFIERLMSRFFGVGRNKAQQDEDREDAREDARKSMGVH